MLSFRISVTQAREAAMTQIGDDSPASAQRMTAYSTDGKAAGGTARGA